MSGSSLDGLDIAHVQLEEVRGKWSFEILHAQCVPFSMEWIADLRRATTMHVGDFLKLHTAFGRYLGEQVNRFITEFDLAHRVHFIASHGHTVFHEPENRTTCQIGDGASIAAITGLPVISDLRAMDVAMGGQGAPIVPIADKLLFGNYDFLLNIGGIANITVANNGEPIAFDICAANQVLNALAEREGKSMDEGGMMAAQGNILGNVLHQLSVDGYYQTSGPKSLSNEAARDMVFPILLESDHSVYDLLHTYTQHIADRVAAATLQYPAITADKKMLITGGGAFNGFLVHLIEQAVKEQGITVDLPSVQVIKYKEAVAMALIGALRWREEENVLSSATGAKKDSVGGALWLGVI
jgi:anhydro-N-acetylmuramic acid kinase